MNQKVLKKIYTYTDYKVYLRDFYNYQKNVNPVFSYRYFGMKTGVASSVLTDIIAGRRKLTLQVMKKYVIFLKLSEQETKYFECMVNFVNSKSIQDKNRFFSEMSAIRGKHVMTFMGHDQYEYFSHWYHAVIREMVTLSFFEEDYEWIARSLTPQITPSQAKKSITFMLSCGLLERNTKGRLIQKNSAISSEYEIASIALKNFQKEMLSLADTSIERIPHDFREISSLTLGVSYKSFKRIKEAIRNFKEELLSMVIDDKTESDTICQLNFQLFPFVTARLNENENNKS